MGYFGRLLLPITGLRRGVGFANKGNLLVAIAAFAFSAVVFGALKATIGVRVSDEEEEG